MKKSKQLLPPCICGRCSKLFFYGYPGVLEIKCSRCGTYNLFTPKDPIRGREKEVKVTPEPREVHDEEL